MKKEWTSYHPDAERLFTAWANGLNAWVAQNADNLPVEFKLTGVKPEPWTAKTLTRAGLKSVSTVLPIHRRRSSASPWTWRRWRGCANRAAAPDPWDDLTVPGRP